MYRPQRRRSLPVLKLIGTYYEVGFDIGRTFATFIQDVINGNVPLNTIYVKYYETNYGKTVYNNYLQNTFKHFPNYVRELQGMADGSKVPFFKLFLYHLDDVLPHVVRQVKATVYKPGCTSIVINNTDEQLLGHVVDGHKTTLNNFFIVKCEITESSPHENFTALCCAGLLPGCILGFNNHGLYYTVNHIIAKKTNPHGIPRTFVTRAILVASTKQEIFSILKCAGNGLADAVSITYAFPLNKNKVAFCNIEASPGNPSSLESLVHGLEWGYKYHFHCNTFHRLKVAEVEMVQLVNMAKESTLSNIPMPQSNYDLINVLGDMSHRAHKIFTDIASKVISVAVAIFDFNAKTLTIYLDNPRITDPCIVLSLEKDFM